MKLAGKTALVTGGSRGIGRSVVETLASAGAAVTFVYQSNSQAAEQLVAELKGKGLDVSAAQADVRSQAQADQVVEQFLEQRQKIDILVNNAGIIRDTLLIQMTEEQWKDVIDTNLNSVYKIGRAHV